MRRIQFTGKRDGEGGARLKRSSTNESGMVVDSPSSPAPGSAPSKKKSGESHHKSKADLILERSPSSMKALRDKSRFNAASPKGESPARHSTPVPAKSPSSLKMVTKDESSEDEDVAYERLRQQGAKEMEAAKAAPKAVQKMDMSDSDDDDDAPVAKSFKDVKKAAIEAQHGEQEDARAVAAKEKEKRRLRTQTQQEQSKKASSKKKEKQKAQEMDVDEEIDLLPSSVLERAMTQTQVEHLVEEDLEEQSKLHRRKMKQLEREMAREDKINSKRVTVVALSDAHGVPQMQSRKAASQSAESFLKEHLWGGRLERMPADHYLSERIRGPAHQFTVPHAASLDSESPSMKSHRRATQHKRKRL